MPFRTHHFPQQTIALIMALVGLQCAAPIEQHANPQTAVERNLVFLEAAAEAWGDYHMGELTVFRGSGPRDTDPEGWLVINADDFAEVQARWQARSQEGQRTVLKLVNRRGGMHNHPPHSLSIGEITTFDNGEIHIDVWISEGIMMTAQWSLNFYWNQSTLTFMEAKALGIY
ncbi:MAG: hypothetical protein GY747_05430 [Planctomycetes bacterium]|nr:hypothetical protein [Planctomycetota bacterium]MCP4860532.1 hypothetical protein [Planctomycetota bacterium]